MFSCSALQSHLPEAFIHRIRPSFIEVFPLLACVSNGSIPMRADRFSNEFRSECVDIVFSFIASYFLPDQVLTYRIKHYLSRVVQVQLLHEICAVTLDGI